MSDTPSTKFFPWLSLLIPVLGWGVLGANAHLHFQGWAVMLLVLMLGATVFSSVHYAEVVACKVGEPFGTLVLAIAVTVIEVAMIASVLLTPGNQNLAVARDTIFSAVMIVCAGVVGLCITVGAWRHNVQGFNIKGSTGALSVVIAMTVLTMVLPVFTTLPDDAFNTRQLIFIAIAALFMYGGFVFVQTVRHRDYFLAEDPEEGSAHAIPTLRQTLIAFSLLLFCLITVVALAKSLSPTLEAMVNHANLPKPLVGLVIALFVLLPESVAATRAALQNKLQNSINLAFGSVIASIGLTIPVVAVVSVVMGSTLVLGLDEKEIVLFVLTMLLNMITIQTGRTNILQGGLLLVVFASFLFFSVFP